ncbi:MAG: hypothetical protein NZM04_04615 [Methylacidiphilales bacterium]|nr:hypothetical protein [Candidatus Methylacidiphilales bacterium]MDW8350088.1 3-methyladenine DNA glycosylase [Verrucomicrobiae bacterium]
MKVKSYEEWSCERENARRRARQFLDPHLERRKRGSKHPIYDFLFEYYSFRPSHLLRWSPGLDVFLEKATSADLAPRWACIDESGAYLDRKKMPRHRFESWQWILQLLMETEKRSPQYACFGLHEWAMVYRGERRHNTTPLRITEECLENVLLSQGVRCTHFDAYRFFTKAALPLNAYPLKADTRIIWEQPGCIHVTMDLYKWAYKLWPWIDTELILDALFLAIEAREIDMRASPYDLSAWGYSAIEIETADGRALYQRLQQELTQKSRDIRKRLICAYQRALVYNAA